MTSCGNHWPSRALTATFTHPEMGDYLFLPLVESVMQDVSEIGIDNLPMTQAADCSITSIYRSDNGVTVAIHSPRRTLPGEDHMSVPPVITSTMRQWRSSKAVRAEKIERIEVGHATVTLHFANHPDGRPHTAYVSHQWNIKHHPMEQGYLVAFEDGFTTYMTANTFETNYGQAEVSHA